MDSDEDNTIHIMPTGELVIGPIDQASLPRETLIIKKCRWLSRFFDDMAAGLADEHRIAWDKHGKDDFEQAMRFANGILWELHDVEWHESLQ